MRSRLFNSLGTVTFFLLASSASSTCFAQVANDPETILPKEIQNRADVQVIIEKLRFLRMNESRLGENHLNKLPSQVQIREYEFDLAKIMSILRVSSKSTVMERSVHVEDTLSQSLASRSNVQAIMGKLRFLRSNNRNLGENHPSKMSTQEQIRRYEFALNKISEEDRLPSPKPDKTGNSNDSEKIAHQEPVDPREVRIINQKLAILRNNLANYGENHRNWITIQNEIREHEDTLATLADLTMPEKLKMPGK